MLEAAFALLFVINPLTLMAAILITKEVFMSEVQSAVDAVVAQLGKAKDEIVSKIADVEAQLEAASVPAEVVDLSALKAAAQALDDVVADAPVEEDAPVE